MECFARFCFVVEKVGREGDFSDALSPKKNFAPAPTLGAAPAGASAGGSLLMAAMASSEDFRSHSIAALRARAQQHQEATQNDSGSGSNLIRHDWSFEKFQAAAETQK